MEIEVTKYESPALVEGELEILKELASVIRYRETRSEVRHALNRHDKKRFSGIYRSVEIDILGFYELFQTMTTSIILKSKFRELKRNEIRDLLLSRIEAVKNGPIELPENLFKYVQIRIEFEEGLIDVTEVASKYWDYTLFKAINYSDEYYVEIVFDGITTYEKIFKLSEEEVQTVRKGNMAKTIAMIHRKRDGGWRL